MKIMIMKPTESSAKCIICDTRVNEAYRVIKDPNHGTTCVCYNCMYDYRWAILQVRKDNRKFNKRKG